MSSCSWMISQMNIIWFICIDSFIIFFLDYCFILFAFLGPKIKSRFIKMLPPPPQPHEKNVFTKGKHSATQPEVESFLHLLGLGERFYLSWVRSLLSMRCMLGYSFKPRPNSSALGKVPRLWPSVLSKECFHSRGPHLCKFLETKESVCIRKEYNSQRIGLGHQHGRRFIVLGHQYGRRDVMWKHSINRFSPLEKPVLPEKTRLTSPEVQAAATSKAWRDSGGAS